MRVTKLIREFVEEEVNKAIPTTGLCPEYIEMREKLDKKAEQIVQTLEEQSKILCEQARVDLHLPDDWKLMPDCYRYITYGGYNSKLYKENDALRDAAEKRREKVIKAILLDMELGEVNKKNLAEAIAKAVEEN